MSVISVKAKVGKKLFYNEDSMFGGYSFYLNKSDADIKVDEKWGNFVVIGNCPMLIEGKQYEFTIKPNWSKKYGDGYEFVDVKERKLTTVSDQQEYLRQVLSKKDAETIIKAYPNVMIVDFIKEGKVKLEDLKGIKEAKAKRIIERLTMYENMQIALVELKDLDVSMNALQRLIDHFGSQEMLIQKVKENIYALTEVEMFAFKKVDEYAMNRGDDPTSPNRIVACFEHIVKEEGKDGHSWTHVDQLLKRAEELLNVPLDNIQKVLHEVKEDSEKFYVKEDKFTLNQYYYYESQIKKHLDRLMNTYTPTQNVIPIEELEKEVGFTFTDEQREAIHMAQQSGIFVLNGKGGVGKTSVLKGIIDSMNNNNYMTCALSGKAAKVLSSKGMKSMTIHRMIMGDIDYDVVVLDEASMVNSQLFYQIVSNLPDGTKFIIVGDNGQLPPIGLAAIFEDLILTKKYPNKELTIVHRQAQKSGILSIANKVRDGQSFNGRYDYSQQVYGELKDMVLMPVSNREDIFDQIVQIAKGYYEKYGEKSFTDFQILTAVKQRGQNSVKNLNKELQGVFNDLDKDCLERNGYQFRELDKIIQSGNNYHAFAYPDMDTYEELKKYEKEEILDDEELVERIIKCSVFNGTIGKIEHINFDKKEVLIKFEDLEGLVAYSQSDLVMIELAYAITVHRSQGMGIKNVLFTFDYVAYKLLSKQMIYTAFTRASEKLVVICENGALHKAIETDHGSTRNTFLKDLLVRDKDE